MIFGVYETMEESSECKTIVSDETVDNQNDARSTGTPKRSHEAIASDKASSAPITEEGERPQKKFYRQRAHCNPLSHNDAFEYPIKPLDMDWTDHYFPAAPKGSTPTILDIGCGFGGLTMALAPLLPDKLILGMEIRAKVSLFVWV